MRTLGLIYAAGMLATAFVVAPRGPEPMVANVETQARVVAVAFWPVVAVALLAVGPQFPTTPQKGESE